MKIETFEKWNCGVLFEGLDIERAVQVALALEGQSQFNKEQHLDWHDEFHRISTMVILKLMKACNHIEGSERRLGEWVNTHVAYELVDRSKYMYGLDAECESIENLVEKLKNYFDTYPPAQLCCIKVQNEIIWANIG